jgi:hypothetical protein
MIDAALKNCRAFQIPAAAFDQVRSVEGLLEAIPQSLIVAYDLVEKYYTADLSMEKDRFKIGARFD